MMNPESENRMQHKLKGGYIFIISLPLVVFGVLLAGWLGPHTHNADLQSLKPAGMSVQVKAVRVGQGELPCSFKAMGEVVTLRQVPTSVVPRISGYVTAMEVVEGQEVEPGAVLVRLDDRLAQNALSRAQSALSAAEAELHGADMGGLDMEQSDLDRIARQMESAALLAEHEAARMTTLFPKGATSQKEAITAQKQEEDLASEAKSATDKANLFRSSGRELKRALLLSAVNKGKADLSDAEIGLDSTVIRAPVIGRITGLKVSVGMTVSEGTVIAQVVGKGSSGLCLWVTTENANQVFVGSSVVYQRDTGIEHHNGTVISVCRQLDQATGLVPIEVALEEGDADLPRLGEVILADVLSKENVTGLLIPDSALVTQDGQQFVYRLDKQNIVHPVPVQVVVRVKESAIIAADNLAEGDLVITDGNYNLPDGARVVTVTVP